MKIQKYHFWLAFFFLIFGYTFAMIIWTIKSAVDTPVYEDRSFMEKYQEVDENYNSLFIKNVKFNNHYDTKVHINNKTVGMDFSDMRYGQRSLEKYSKNQNMLILGNNTISLEIVDRESKKPISDANISFQITRPIKNDSNIDVENFIYKDGKYTAKPIKLSLKGYWNIIAKVIVGDDTGYLYIKTGIKPEESSNE